MQGDGRAWIKIVARPEGEAPEWVRDAWIGVSLPLLFGTPGVFEGVGVITGPKTWLATWWCRLRGRLLKVDGYLVSAREAVDLLSFANPPAAQWWRENTPDLLGPKGHFIFDRPACQPL